MLYLNWRSDGHGNAKGIRVQVTRVGQIIDTYFIFYNIDFELGKFNAKSNN